MNFISAIMRFPACRLLRVGGFVLMLLLAFDSHAQPGSKPRKEQLQAQMRRLQEEIKTIEAAIKNTSAKKEKSMGEILSLQAKIRSRERLINNINNQIGDLDNNISQTETDIEDKSQQVERMKGEYAQMLRKSYENLTLQNELVFMLSSSSFYDAIQRYNYLLKLAEYRKAQAQQIQKAIGELQVKKVDLEENKSQKENLLTQQKEQKGELEKEKEVKDQAVADLQEKEKNLRKRVAEKNKAAQQLNNRIKDIIEEEIRAAKKKAEEQARKAQAQNNTGKPVAKTTTSDVMPLTPEEQALSKSFAGNMGKLPWPVERGHVVAQFGKHEHPLLKGVVVENNGVDIKTNTGSEARAVFGGTVVSIFFLPTLQNCVMIKHGEYFTVYSNIETVEVKTSQTVTTKQSLGKLHTDKNEDLTKVHLEIWKGKDKMDPEQWLMAN